MRRLVFLLVACAAFCPASRADFIYQSRVIVNGGEPIVTTRAMKGTRLAILTHRHTDVIDLDAATVTQIDYAKKTYSVIPFDQWKKRLVDAAKAPQETTFKISRHPGASPNKPIGILNAAESVIDLTGASSGISLNIDTWVGTLPGYEQVRDFTDRLAAKLGYTFAAGLAEAAQKMPEASQGINQAVKLLNQVPGAPIQTTIKINQRDSSVGEISIELSKFGGGAQPAVTFNVPDGFKKVD